MHPNPKRIIPVVIILVIAGIAYWFYSSRAAAQTNGLEASGTIETTEIIISPELAGRVSEVKVGEGDSVEAGDVLVALDATLLKAQREQAVAALAAAAANYASLKEGAAAEQLAAAVARAEAEALAAQQTLDALNDTADLAAAQAESEVAQARDQLDKAEQRLRNLGYPDLEFYQDRVDQAQDALRTAQENAEIIDIGSLQAGLQAARDFLKTAEERLGKIQAAIDGCPTCDPARQVTVDRIPQTLNDAREAYNDARNRVRELELKIEQAKRGNADQIKNAQDAFDDAKQDLDWAQRGPDTIDVAIAQANVSLAKARLAEAQRHYAERKSGPDPDLLAAAQARLAAAKTALAAAKAAAAPDRLDAAQAQVDGAKAALNVLDAQIAKLTLAAPMSGVILSRAVEPGSVTLPGSTLLVLADLSRLQITVYAPEDQYGVIKLGQTANVSVDSYPDETFTATVTRIADKAEFTPRNVQTTEGRKTTVFAIQLSIANAEGKLKPGMPADVAFE